MNIEIKRLSNEYLIGQFERKHMWRTNWQRGIVPFIHVEMPNYIQLYEM